MLCRCKYSTSLILILIVSTPDVSCKHFVSHGLSIEPLVLLHLYLQMPHPGNVVQEEFSSAEEEPHEASASVWFSSTAFLSRFCISAIFFFLSMSKQVLYICKNINLENTFKAESFLSCICLPRSPPSWCYCLRARTGCGWQESGCGGTHLEPAAPAWPIIAMGLVTMSCPDAAELCVGFCTAVMKCLWWI